MRTPYKDASSHSSYITDQDGNSLPSYGSSSSDSPGCARRFLGTFSESIYREKLARGERIFGEPLSMEPVLDKCGIYDRGTILRNVKFAFHTRHENYTYFHIIYETMTTEELEWIQGVPKIMLRGEYQMYSSNPYHSDIGLIKLYLDPRTKRVHRCIIDDLYCQLKHLSLTLQATITLIDLGETFINVDYDHIFDFSQRTGHLMERDPGAIKACLFVPVNSQKIPEINSSLKELVSNSQDGKIFNVKILDYDNDLYQVDVITELEFSFLDSLSNKYEQDDFRSSSSTSELGKEIASPYEFRPIRKSLPKTHAKRCIKTRPSKQKTQVYKPPAYLGANHYFTTLLKLRMVPETSLLSNRLFKVMMLDWYAPDQLVILPYDANYSHAGFIKKLHSLKCVKQAGNAENMKDKLYEPGEFVFFRNVFRDDELGPWLRGRVVSLSCFNQHNLVIPQQRTEKDRLDNFEIVSKVVKDGKFNPDDIIYRVRSVDYGCECRSSPFNMRRVTDLHEFKSLGTWSLQCKLFGVYPFEQDDWQYTDQSLDAFQGWIRDRFLDDDTGFRVLFRSYLQGSGAHVGFDQLVEVSLFHRFDPKVSKQCKDDLLPQPMRYDCLNWDMVDRGLASSSDHRDVNSNVQLEDHVVTQLVAHSKL